MKKHTQQDIKIKSQRYAFIKSENAYALEILYLDMKGWNGFKFLSVPTDQVLKALQDTGFIVKYENNWVAVLVPTFINAVKKLDWIPINDYMQKNLPESPQDKGDKALALDLLLHFINNQVITPEKK